MNNNLNKVKYEEPCDGRLSSTVPREGRGETPRHLLNKKLFYEAPEVEQIELRLENNQMQSGSPNYGEDGAAGPNASYNKYEEDY